MNSLNSYISQLETMSDHSFKNAGKHLSKVTKKLSVKSELLKSLNSTTIDKNRSIPVQLLDKEGNVKSMSAAFEFVFPQESVEYATLELDNVSKYQEYELKFGDLPEDC
ncbi:Hypothetical_protein [Hexamita inflata]|uniref:Hypothetical_protein n=1 Tax=Hexamita inflata TaxID=28002 RepID=A0AA86NFQ0_9EUKA|nr:Hypothetical protein HINF_LOCUS6086 [Hexamita inflata]